MRDGEMNRRDFIRKAAIGTTAIIGLSSGPGWLLNRASAQESSQLTSHEIQTLQALFDAIIPGPSEPSHPDETEDPEGAPGAIEGNALRSWEHVLPQWLDGMNVAFLKLWVVDLDLFAFVFHGGRPFKQLRLRERQEKIQLMMWILPGYHLKYWGALLLTKVAFYADLADEENQSIGRDYIGFPGPNGGYSDYSYRVHPYYIGDGS